MFRASGVLVFRASGILVFRVSWILVFRVSWILVFRVSWILVFRVSWILVFRVSGVLMFRVSGTGEILMFTTLICNNLWNYTTNHSHTVFVKVYIWKYCTVLFFVTMGILIKIFEHQSTLYY